MKLIILLVALAPALVWLTYFRDRDDYRTSAEGVWSAFLVGALISLVGVVISLVVAGLVGPQQSQNVQAAAAVKAFLVTAIPEETVKLAAIIMLFWRQRAVARPYDFVVYAVAVSAGFAAFENLLYVDSPEWRMIAIIRSVTAVPSHIFGGAIMGACLAAALTRPDHPHRFWFLAFLLPVAFHGVYDFLPFLQTKIKAAGAVQDQTQIVLAFEAFILVVIVEGIVADWYARRTLARPYDRSLDKFVRTRPAWHWANHPTARFAFWGGTATVAGFAGAVAFSVSVLASRNLALFPDYYQGFGLATFALYHGLAFAARARLIRRQPLACDSP